jgi:DNA mismatch endonuclease, patch repair protein
MISSKRDRSVTRRTEVSFASDRMKNVKRRDTGPELRIRRAVFARGLRYRVDVVAVPGVRSRPDLVFFSAKVAVFVDSCFWHACPVHGTRPKTNSKWWQEKLESNRRRDEESTRLLSEAGWWVERVWEHEVVEDAAERIVGIVRGRLRQ